MRENYDIEQYRTEEMTPVPEEEKEEPPPNIFVPVNLKSLKYLN